MSKGMSVEYWIEFIDKLEFHREPESDSVLFKDFYAKIDKLNAHLLIEFLKSQQAEIERLKAYEPNWILCSERLPELNQQVLFYSPTDDCLVNHYTVSEREQLNNGEIMIWSSAGSQHGYLPQTYFTHWQPLPKKPEAK